MIKKSVCLVLSIVTIAFVSCNSGNEESKNAENIDVVDSVSKSTDSLNNNLTEDFESSYNLPSALQIAYVFKKSGAGFNMQLLNSKSNASKYNTSNYKRAVNFGIYSTDIAYCIFNKKYQEAKESLKACKDVGAFLGINQAFESDNMIQRFDKNISNEDSIIKIISNVQLKTDIMFEQNKQKHIVAIAFTGAWTESVFIALDAYKSEKNKKILSSLMEQLLLSETIIKALKNYQDTEPELKDLISKIENINSLVNKITSVKSAIEKGEEINFDLISVTDTELQPISETVKSLREEMIK
jgi:hypothetical protein